MPEDILLEEDETAPPEFAHGRCETCDCELTDENDGELCPTCGAYRIP